MNEFWKQLPRQPLDEILTNGGFCSIFRTIAVIGDSLSSGEFESNPRLGYQWHDYYEHSWGQYLARMTGAKVYNFSKGGMTAQEYCESFADQYGYWDQRYRSQAYILALGANDLLYRNFEPGTVSDICLEDHQQNKPTFTGYFAKIIQRLRQVEPNARFFLLTMPYEPDVSEEQQKMQDLHADLMGQIAALFPNTYVIDLRKYGPAYDEEFHKNFYLHGHLNPAGYYLTARLVATYIDYIIRSDFASFSQVGFIGTPYYEENL